MFKSTLESYETSSKLADHLWGNELAESKRASDFSDRKVKAFAIRALFVNSYRARFCFAKKIV